ncbi:MAG: hypothetical protein IIY81_11000 [Lachnospiraceae bacterium]|nr:hypothetical protein [Lachnospiraceae bacterium]
MIRIGRKKEGITLTFELRGIEPELVDDVWYKLRPFNIINSAEETGSCLCCLDDIAVEIRRTKKGNYTIWFGREDK